MIEEAQQPLRAQALAGLEGGGIVATLPLDIRKCRIYLPFVGEKARRSSDGDARLHRVLDLADRLAVGFGGSGCAAAGLCQIRTSRMEAPGDVGCAVRPKS